MGFDLIYGSPTVHWRDQSVVQEQDSQQMWKPVGFLLIVNNSSVNHW